MTTNEPTATAPQAAPPLSLELMLRFCAPDPNRYSLNAPFVIAGWKYATDGHIGIRIPAPGESDVDHSARRVPRTPQDIFAIGGPENQKKSKSKNQPEYNPTWLSFPDCPSCDWCNGSGTDLKCHICKGDGEHYCDTCDSEHKCGPCEGSGKGTLCCSECRSIKNSKLFGLAKIRVASHFCHLISLLPQAEYAEPGDRKDCLRFRFSGGGDGVVMGLREGD